MLLYPNDQGRIFDADQLILWPPMNVHSLLGRGYWEEHTGNVNIYELLKKATKMGDGNMIYNFRIDRSQRDFLKRELVDNKRIYQGWGQFNLKNDQFVKETRNYYNLRSTRIPNNLTKIRSFRDGDVLLVPHFPTDGCVSILIVDGNFPACYEWKPGQKNHLNHGIKIRQFFGLDGNISMYHHSLVGWYGKLSGLRLPIISIDYMAKTVEDIIFALKENPDKAYPKSTIDDYLSVQTTALLESLRNQLQQLNPNNSALSFEKVCEDLISQYGYTIVERNCYDGSGGDADLVFKKENQGASPFEIGESYLFVQIKKHKGETDERAVDQLLRIMDTEKNYTPANGCVISLADTFSEAALTKAADSGIKLINGIEFCRLLASNALLKSSD